MHCRHKPLPCARALTRQLMTAHSASLPAVPTSSWISRQMWFSWFSRMVCGTDRASTCVFLYFFCPNYHFFFDFFCRSGTQLCGLLYLISRPAISTKSHSPYRSCTRCSIPFPRSPTPTSRNPHHPHTPHDVPPATICPASARPTLFPPCADHTVC